MSMSWAEYEDLYGESREELMRSEAEEDKLPDIKEYYDQIVPLRKDLEQLLKEWDKDCEPEKMLEIVARLEDIASELYDIANEEYFDGEYDGLSEEERIFGPGGFHGWANPGMTERHNREQRERLRGWL